MVSIPNIELFEKAAKHQLSLNPCTSNITDLAVDNCDKVNLHILNYLRAYKSLPFPLNNIEDDIKYIVIGTYMMSKSNQSTHMWVDNGLIVVLDEADKKVVRFKGVYWAIQTVSELKDDNLNLENWQDYVGYKEYGWVLKQLLTGAQTSKFYEEFMPNFVKACKNQQEILKRELNNILKFGYIPKEQEFPANVILDKARNERFTLDIYVQSIIHDKNKKIISIQNDVDSAHEQYQSKKIYGFNTLKKPIEFVDDMKPGDDKLKHSSLPCMAQIFQRLVAIKATTDQANFQDFRGAIIGDWLVFSINGRLYIGDKKMSFGDTEIAEGVTLHSIDKRNVYFYKTYRVGECIYKRNIYCYNFNDRTTRVINIDFVRER